MTLMLFDSCLSLIETVGYYKGQPTPYSYSSKNVAFAILYAKDTAGTLFYHKTSYLILKQPIRGVQIRPFYNIDL